MRAGRALRTFRGLPALCALLAVIACGCGGSDSGSSGDASTGTFLVGAATRDITPADPVYLGGYGDPNERRLSAGVLAPIFVRALVVSDGTHTVAIAQSDTQGAFGAYKRGPFGLADAAVEVETATGGAIRREHVIISSDHTHSGPDTTGVWRGLPNSYLMFLKEQTVAAIVAAFTARQPARLLIGATDATELLRSQFDQPPNDRVSGELRTLVAVDPENPQHYRAVLINYAAHATVMGPSNTQISGDWPEAVAVLAEQQLPADTALVMIGDCGRTQPNRDGTAGLSEPEKLSAYADAVMAHVAETTRSLTPVHGTAVDTTQLFLRETYANPIYPVDLLKGIISRADTPPWLDGETIGTVVSAARLGDVLLAAVPGEAYPAILAELVARVPAERHFIFGLANDQLGYLIAPQEGYQQVFDAAPDNDNAIFNVSPAIGDHVMCTLLTAARTLGFMLPADPDKCAMYSGENLSLPF
jgi:neutral/alkaline ceramidase-like enzyme